MIIGNLGVKIKIGSLRALLASLFRRYASNTRNRNYAIFFYLENIARELFVAISLNCRPKLKTTVRSYQHDEQDPDKSSKWDAKTSNGIFRFIAPTSDRPLLNLSPCIEFHKIKSTCISKLFFVENAVSVPHWDVGFYSATSILRETMQQRSAIAIISALWR